MNIILSISITILVISSFVLSYIYEKNNSMDIIHHISRLFFNFSINIFILKNENETIISYIIQIVIFLFIFKDLISIYKNFFKKTILSKKIR